MPLLYLRYAKYATSPDLILRGGHLTEIWIDLSFAGGRKKVFFFGDEFAPKASPTLLYTSYLWLSLHRFIINLN
jgi:hypothetical protein